MSAIENNKIAFILLSTAIILSVVSIIFALIIYFSIQPLIGSIQSPLQDNEPQETLTEESGVEDIQNSQQLLAYLQNDFDLVAEEKKSTSSPLAIFLQAKGNDGELAILTDYLLNELGLESVILEYHYLEQGSDTPKTNIVVVFRDSDEVPKYIPIRPGEIDFIVHGSSFNDLFQKERELLDIEIVDYAILSWHNKDLEPEEWYKIR